MDACSDSALCNLGSREYIIIANDRAHNKLEHIIITIYVAKRFCGGGGEGTYLSLSFFEASILLFQPQLQQE